MGGDSRGDVEMSKLGEVEEVKEFLGEFREVLNAFINKTDPENNSLPLDGLHWLIAIETDCEDLVEHLSDYNSYDPG